MRKAWMQYLDGSIQHFAEVEPGHWLSISREAEPGDEAEVLALHKGDGRMRPMTYATRWFGLDNGAHEIAADLGAEFTELPATE